MRGGVRGLLAARVTGDHLSEVCGQRDRGLTAARTAVPGQRARRQPGNQPCRERIRIGRPETRVDVGLCREMILKRHANSVRQRLHREQPAEKLLLRLSSEGGPIH
jgi:hypothetical protein